jgi:glycosyltransferase involved in cell wall biosynthesis
MFVSVIIPTYNRKDVLRETLLSLGQQTYSFTQYEVVIADDGSTDGTGEMVAALPAPCAIRHDWQANRGVNAARNRGTRLARGPLLLFLDDDMLADPGLIEAHAESHTQHQGIIVKGRVIWRPLGEWTTFARVTQTDSDLNETPDENGFISFFSVFAGHFSIRRADALAAGPWEEGWKPYGFFDLDFMYRAHKSGLRMLYDPRAVTYHRDYAAGLRQHCKRIRVAATKAVTQLFLKHPELEGQMAMFRDKGYVRWREDPPNIVLRKLARTVMIWPPALAALEGVTQAVEALYPSPALLRPLYRWVIGTYICLGYREGLKARHG